MAIMQASKLQARVLGLLGKEFDGTYDMAARLLEEMGLPKNGAPEGYTARQANKLSDDELLALLPEADTSVEVLTTQELKAQERAHWARVRAEAEARREAEEAESAKVLKSRVIPVRGMDYGHEDQVVYYPAVYLPRPVFNELYQAGAMYHDPELATWVIDPERAKAAGYVCEILQAKVTNISLQDEIEG